MTTSQKTVCRDWGKEDEGGRQDGRVEIVGGRARQGGRQAQRARRRSGFAGSQSGRPSPAACCLHAALDEVNSSAEDGNIDFLSPLPRRGFRFNLQEAGDKLGGQGEQDGANAGTIKQN